MEVSDGGQLAAAKMDAGQRESKLVESRPNLKTWARHYRDHLEHGDTARSSMLFPSFFRRLLAWLCVVQAGSEGTLSRTSVGGRNRGGVAAKNTAFMLVCFLSKAKEEGNVGPELWTNEPSEVSPKADCRFLSRPPMVLQPSSFTCYCAPQKNCQHSPRHARLNFRCWPPCSRAVSN